MRASRPPPTSMNSATCGRTTKLAMRAAPSSCGFTTRSAPARPSLSMLSSWRALATMNSAGLSVRPDRVTNRFAASSASAAADEPERLCGQKSLCPNEPVDDQGTMLCASLVREPEQSLAAAATKTVPAPQAIATQAPANGPVIFTALEEGIWVKFYDGRGKQLMQKQLAKGESYTVPVDAFEPRVWTGRPDALAITIGGQPIPRLADAEKVMKDVPVDTASLRARSTLPLPSSGADATPNGRTAATGSGHL